jgi:hypothetical protein
MNTKVNKAYFFIPVLYAAVIIFLLYMQFSGSHGFSAEVSGIEISGRTRTGAPGQGDYISDLQIGCNGISFTFDEENPLLVYTQDGLTHNTVPIDYRVTASGVDVRLNKNIGISFFVLQNSNDIINISLTAEDPESIKYIAIPLIEDKGNQISIVEGVPVLSVTTVNDSRFFLSLPEGTSFIEETKMLKLFPTEEGFSELAFERSVDTSLDAFTYWFSGNSTLISAADLKTTIEEYLSKTVAGLRTSRFNADSGSWSTKTGLSDFNEKALVAAVSEGINRPNYSSVKKVLDRAAVKNSDELSILSSSLFGNIVNEGWAYDRNLERKLVRLENRTANADYSVFTDEDLSIIVLSEDSEVLTENLIQMTKTLSDAEIDIREASGMLRFYQEIKDAYPELGSKFSAFTSVIDTEILPSIKVLSDSLFLVDENDKTDILLSLHTGLMMIKSIETDGASNINDLGRELVSSSLKLSDDLGFLPKSALEGEDGNLVTEDSIAPEEVYPLLSDNPYYPEEEFYFVETGEKISVLNQAESFDIEKTDYGYRMTFDFPVGKIHTFAVRNIKPFYQMNLLGYKWNSDHRFLQYFSGWWYDKDNSTMYVKIRHRTETEEILIFTEKPVSPPAESANTAAPAEEPAIE